MLLEPHCSKVSTLTTGRTQEIPSRESPLFTPGYILIMPSGDSPPTEGHSGNCEHNLSAAKTRRGGCEEDPAPGSSTAAPRTGTQRTHGRWSYLNRDDVADASAVRGTYVNVLRT